MIRWLKSLFGRLSGRPQSPVTVTLKVDLGGIDEDAIYVRTRRDFMSALQKARGS